MKLFKVRATQLIGDHTLLLTVVPKRARDRIKFYPGQYAAIGFKKQGRPSPVRCFSFVSSPGSTDAIQFAMRVKGDFTQAVAQLKPDETVFLYGPFGDFTIKQSHDQNIILLAGGIGVTPLISMVRRATEISLPNKITLLYSVSSSSAIPFRSEITQLEKLNPNFKAAYFVTQDQADKSPPSNFHYDRISSSTIMSYTGKDIGKYTFFLCGPQQFIKSLTTELKNNNVAEDKIITEEFSPAGVSANIFKQPESKVSRWTYGLTAASLLAAAGVFMTLDLARFVPKQLQSQAATTHTVSHHSQNTDDDFTENSSSPTSNDNSSTNSAVVTPTTPSTGNVNVVPTPSQTYRQPVTPITNRFGKRLFVATSGTTKRQGVSNRGQWHHIIDPKTGLPAMTEYLTVTVVSDNGAKADVLAKAILIDGAKQAEKFKITNQLTSYVLQSASQTVEVNS